MTARELARVGLLLLGVYLIVESLASGADSLTGRPFMVRPGGGEIPDIINSSLVGFGMSFVGVVLYGVLPGAVLIAKSRAWSEAWCPETGTLLEVPVALLAGVGFLLLGLNFAVGGLAGIVGGIVQITLSEGWAFEYGWRTLAASMVSLLSGLGLFLFGRRVIGGTE